MAAAVAAGSRAPSRPRPPRWSSGFQGIARSRDGAVAYVETHEVRISGGSVTSAETR